MQMVILLKSQNSWGGAWPTGQRVEPRDADPDADLADAVFRLGPLRGRAAAGAARAAGRRHTPAQGNQLVIDLLFN